MAGFSVHLCLLMRHSTVEIGKDGHKGRTKPGYLETSFLEQLVDKDHVECRGLPNEVRLHFYRIVYCNTCTCTYACIAHFKTSILAGI